METILVETWLKQVLTSDEQLQSAVAGRVMEYVAPLTTPSPFVVLEYVEGEARDEKTQNSTRIFSVLPYSVVVIGEVKQLATIKPIADRVDELLEGASGSVSGGEIISCERIKPLSSVEVEPSNGKQYRYLGGLYLISVQKSGG